MTNEEKTNPALVRALLAARDQREPAADIAGILPTSLEAAYADQAEHAQQILARIGGTRIGSKIGATNKAVLAALNLPNPFHGPIFSELTWTSPVSLARSSFFAAIIEAEIGFRFGRDLPARQAPYSAETIEAAIAEMLPIIEIADSRLQNWQRADPRAIIADLGYAGAVILGPPTRDWRSIDLPSLAVTLDANGVGVAAGTGSAVMGNPWSCLVGFINDLSAAGKTFRADELVSSGSCTTPYPATANQHFVARFGPLGTVELTLT